MTLDTSLEAAWREMQKRHRGDGDGPPLKGDGGGGTSEDMALLKDYVDARDDAVESRLNAKLDKLATHRDIRNSNYNTWGAIAVALGIVAAFLAFGGDRFDAGLSMSDVRQAQLAKDAAQDKRMLAVDQKLDLILAAQSNSKRATGASNVSGASQYALDPNSNQAASAPIRR